MLIPLWYLPVGMVLAVTVRELRPFLATLSSYSSFERASLSSYNSLSSDNSHFTETSARTRLLKKQNFSVIILLILILILATYGVGASESPDRDCCEPLYPFFPPITSTTSATTKARRGEFINEVTPEIKWTTGITNQDIEYIMYKNSFCQNLRQPHLGQTISDHVHHLYTCVLKIMRVVKF